MADIVWTDLTGDGSFDDAANWLGGSVPGAADEATILLPGTVTTGGGETIDELTLGLGATLIARNFTILGIPDADSGTGTTTNAGSIVVADNSNVFISGTVDNTGTLLLDGSYNGDALYVGNGTVSTLTLTGGGTLALTDFSSNFIDGNVAGAVLDNVNNTIAGAGYVGDGNLSVVNAGTIAATGTAATLILRGAGVTNTALIEAAGSAGLEIRDTVLNAGGTILAAGGNVDVEGGADIVGGTLIGTSGGLVVLSGTPLLDGATSGAILLQGTAELADNNNVVVDGTLNNKGTLLLDGSYNGDALYVGTGTAPTLTLTGGGTLALTDFSSNFVDGNVAGAVLDNADNTIAGAGYLGDGNLSVVNAGTIAATGTDATLILRGVGVTNTALIEAAGPAGLEIRETVLNAGGTILAAAGNVDVEGGADIVGGTLRASGGVVVLSGSPLLDGATSGAILLQGTAELADNNSVVVDGTLNNKGTLLLDGTYNGDTLYVGYGSVSTLTLTGGGTVALTDFTSNFISGGVPGAVLDNVDNTIAGAGYLGDGNLTVVNTGTIAATGTAATLILRGPQLTNTALIEAAGPAGLEIRETVLNASGTIAAAAGNVDVEGGADIVGGSLTGTKGVVVLSGTPLLDGATSGAILLQGTAELADNNNVVVDGTLNNKGTLLLDGTYNGDALYVGSGTPSLTLTGGGTVALTDFNGNFISGGVSGAVLDNADNTIAGAGYLGDGNLTVVNAGTIAATGTAATLILRGAGVTNTALIEATGPAGLEIRDTVLNAGGTIAAASGNVDVEGGADIVGGTLRSTGGIVALSGTPLLDGATHGAVLLQGTAELADNNDAYAIGTLTNAGTLLLDGTYNGDALYVGNGSGSASTLTLTGGGTLAMTDFNGNFISGGVSGAVLDNADNTIEGAGYLGDGNLSVINAGTIEATGTAASLTLRGPALTNSGLIAAVGPAGLDIQDGTVGNTGTLLAAGTGALTVDGPITGAGQLETEAGSTLVLLGSVAAGQTVDFLGASTLRLGTPTSFAGSLASVFAGVTIDLPNDTLTSVTLAGGVLDLVGNFGTADYTVLGSTAGVGAFFQADGSGGDEVLFTGGSPPVVCFCAGTRIATPDGERAVETLAAGDMVLTAEGAARPIRWLGRQTVATRFADRTRVAPIRIREGAFAEHLPRRDLLVSPDHALMVQGVFVQAGALVNGVSITREEAGLPERFTYFHVELAEHSLILAEGVAAETFIDNVDRLAFDNWDEHVALGDDAAPMREMPQARAKAHRQVPHALRAALVVRGVDRYGSDVAVVA